ncbi:MAG TPA: DUF4097 family beta strand repeat-containing protein [Blastocatellia bacterium]|nr:DUF4097 family beta strand repeat-containing protein [Blastocatellia bacterium]
MKRYLYRAMVLSWLVCLGCSLMTRAQDFQRSYQIGAGGSVKVHNISGDVIVTGYSGDAIVVTGTKTGRDREQVTVEDRSSGNQIDLGVRYPENCNCDASVRFEVKVPNETRYKFESISSVSGNVQVSGVSGDLKAKSVSGQVTVKGVEGPVDAKSVSGNVLVGEVDGTVSAKSVSGNVEVGIRTLRGSESLEFASVSGNVQARIPANLDAEVTLSTRSGDLKTDFPLTVEEPRPGSGRRATGRLGGGSRTLKLNSVSGNVSLLRM